MRGVKIGKNVLLGFNVTLDNIYPNLITIEDGVSLAGNNLILAHSKPMEYYKDIFESYAAPVVIKKNAWVTVGVIILAGVTIGEGSVIVAGSVVNEDIPANCIAAGNPAKAIRAIEKKQDGSTDSAGDKKTHT
ncbi:acyltransferase [Chloroflexota bacterium]